jgi:hypothetical protein
MFRYRVEPVGIYSRSHGQQGGGEPEGSLPYSWLFTPDFWPNPSG